MQIGERIDEREPDTPVQLGPAGKFGGYVVADHKTVPALFDDKHRAENAFILA